MAVASGQRKEAETPKRGVIGASGGDQPLRAAADYRALQGV